MDKKFLDAIKGKEVHFRLVSNHLLETGKPSLTAVATGGAPDAMTKACKLESRDYSEYPIDSVLLRLIETARGGGIPEPAERRTVVVVAENDGVIGADDARYVEWLARKNSERPLLISLPSQKQAASPAAPAAAAVSSEEEVAAFWPRQWTRMKAIPAPITKDAAIAAIPRTAIPVTFSLILGYLNRDTIPMERALTYTGLAFSFAVGFALLNQSVLNYITFCGNLTRDIFRPAIKAVESRLGGGPAARFIVNALSFVSARGDVFIADPSLGIGCTYLARLALGPVGETVSVLSLYGFLMVVGNVLTGSFAGGPYTQCIAHLRSVGKISNRMSMYLGIVETVKMELGRLADFGMQTFYNAAQMFLACFFWTLLLVVDRCYRKPEAVRITCPEDAALVASLFEALRAQASSRKPSVPSKKEAIPA
jgi:hypothetical protein